MAAYMCRSLVKAEKIRKLLHINSWTLYSAYSSKIDNAEDEIMYGSTTDMVEDHYLDIYEPAKNFASLFRHSAFAQLGDFRDKKVIGTIETVRGDDLYIDFGGKFHCVCPRPAKNGELYKKGTLVRLLLHDMEMCSSFLGSEKHISLLEADCTLLGLHSVKLKKIQPQESTSETTESDTTNITDEGKVTLAKIEEASYHSKQSR